MTDIHKCGIFDNLFGISAPINPAIIVRAETKSTKYTSRCYIYITPPIITINITLLYFIARHFLEGVYQI